MKGFIVATKDLYPTYEELKQAVQDLGITSQAEYRKVGIKADSRFSLSPQNKYKDDWKGWGDLIPLGSRQRFKIIDKNKNIRTYSVSEKFYTYVQAKQVAQEMGISSHSEYQKARDTDKKLPSCPSIKYEDSWPGWKSFLKNPLPLLQK